MDLKKCISTFICAISLCAGIIVYAAPNNDIMNRLDDGTYVIDTTALCSDIKGFRGETPVKVFIKKDKIIKIEYLPNRETPRFFDRLKEGFQETWNGMKVNEAVSVQPDAHTGATISAKSVSENVKQALEYYQKHKSK